MDSSTSTIYFPESDTLACGCDPDWPDHRCRYGCRVCGAPDDCYCPSPGEIWSERLDGVTFPARVQITDFRDGRMLGTRGFMTFTLSDLVVLVIEQDPDAVEFDITDAADQRLQF